ncbi:carbohydrate kinase family protein [soil metagenome]
MPEQTDSASSQHSGPDVFLAGHVFLDLIFTGLAAAPPPGTEVFTLGLGTAPGGIANLAVAMSRLGLSVSLATVYGDDLYGEFLHQVVSEQEQVDLSRSRQLANWSTPVTVSMAFGGDRSMISYREPMPLELDDLVDDPPPARACFIHIDQPPPQWIRKMRERGTLVFADLGWDDTGVWASTVLDRLAMVDVFVPNDAEAMAYTRTGTPEEALDVLVQKVDTVAVKCGARGVVAASRSTSERVEVRALPVLAIDPTGAGDVFAAALVVARRQNWSLAQQVDFANLCAGLSVRHHSGSLGAPCWHDIAEWLVGAGAEMRERYSYLLPILPDVHEVDRARAMPTLRAPVR